MKQIVYLTLLCIFCTTVYAQTESSSQIDSSSQMQSVQVNQDDEKTGFFSLNIGGEVTPSEKFAYHTTVVGLNFGGLITQQHTFNAGLKFTTARIESSFLTFNYAYSFIKGRQWIPGVDISLLIGLRQTYDTIKNENVYLPSIGGELGPYLKTFISRSHALILRAGVTHDTNTEGDFDFQDLRMYLNLGVQWYF